MYGEVNQALHAVLGEDKTALRETAATEGLSGGGAEGLAAQA
jgi:hypothetical protein